MIFVYDLIKFSKVKNEIVISNKYKLEFLVDEKNFTNKAVEKTSSLLSELSKDISNYFHVSYISELNENNEELAFYKFSPSWQAAAAEVIHFNSYKNFKMFFHTSRLIVIV